MDRELILEESLKHHFSWILFLIVGRTFFFFSLSRKLIMFYAVISYKSISDPSLQKRQACQYNGALSTSNQDEILSCAVAIPSQCARESMPPCLLPHAPAAPTASPSLPPLPCSSSAFPFFSQEPQIFIFNILVSRRKGILGPGEHARLAYECILL